MPGDLARYGEVLEVQPPKAKIRVGRQVIAEVLAAVLHDHTLEDVSVEDPPLEEVIAEVFSLSAASHAAKPRPVVAGRPNE